jgi:CheY-like chemotaxis protein
MMLPCLLLRSQGHSFEECGPDDPAARTVRNDLREAKSRTALIVDPSLVGRLRLRRLLLGAGFARVLEAESGVEAVTVLAEELVALVFTVWEERPFSGAELIRSLRNRGRNRRVPVVLLDDGLPQQTVVAAVKAGVAGRLPFPPTASRLAELLRSIREGQTGPERQESNAGQG